jgi:hypothetical protein
MYQNDHDSVSWQETDWDHGWCILFLDHVCLACIVVVEVSCRFASRRFWLAPAQYKIQGMEKVGGKVIQKAVIDVDT